MAHHGCISCNPQHQAALHQTPPVTKNMKQPNSRPPLLRPLVLPGFLGRIFFNLHMSLSITLSCGHGIPTSVSLASTRCFLQSFNSQRRAGRQYRSHNLPHPSHPSTIINKFYITNKSTLMTIHAKKSIVIVRTLFFDERRLLTPYFHRHTWESSFHLFDTVFVVNDALCGSGGKVY